MPSKRTIKTDWVVQDSYETDWGSVLELDLSGTMTERLTYRFPSIIPMSIERASETQTPRPATYMEEHMMLYGLGPVLPAPPEIPSISKRLKIRKTLLERQREAIGREIRQVLKESDHGTRDDTVGEDP